MKKFKVELTEREVKHVATVFARIAGKLQWQAANATTTLDERRLAVAWRLNSKLAKKFANTFDYESWAEGFPLGLGDLGAQLLSDSTRRETHGNKWRVNKRAR